MDVVIRSLIDIVMWSKIDLYFMEVKVQSWLEGSIL